MPKCFSGKRYKANKHNLLSRLVPLFKSSELKRFVFISTPGRGETKTLKHFVIKLCVHKCMQRTSIPQAVKTYAKVNKYFWLRSSLPGPYDHRGLPITDRNSTKHRKSQGIQMTRSTANALPPKNKIMNFRPPESQNEDKLKLCQPMQKRWFVSRVYQNRILNSASSAHYI